VGRVKTSVSIERDLWREVRVECERRDMDKSEAVEEGLRGWLSRAIGEDSDTKEIKVLANTSPDSVKLCLLDSQLTHLSDDDLRTISALAEMMEAGEEDLLISALRHMAHAYLVAKENPRNKHTSGGGGANGPGRKAS
jgi:predicted DNA-binding ribbon-helix-helix protein